MMLRRTPILLGLLLLVGCGGYANTSGAFRKALDQGQPATALEKVDEALGVQRPEDLPSEKKADTTLLLLERGTILQAMGRYKLSSRDFQLADKDLEVLDLSGDAVGSVSKYLFSDDATLYKAPPHEKLLLNTLNIINYLALGDHSGAKVEARRFIINRKFYDSQSKGAKGMLALGSYLAGYAFEAAKEPGPAMRHYGDVYETGQFPTLKRTVARLHVESGAQDPRLKSLYSTEVVSTDEETAELLIIVQTGMSPFRKAERLPIGAAIVQASRPGHGARLSSADRHRATSFAAKGLVKWVNIPSLQRVAGQRGHLSLQLGGKKLRPSLALDVESRVTKEYESIQGTLLVASLTRMLTRAVAGQISQSVTKGASKNGLAGLLVGLAVEGAMTAADTPDTRSWVTLPGRIYLTRIPVKPGQQHVVLHYRGQTLTADIKIASGDHALINFSAQR